MQADQQTTPQETPTQALQKQYGQLCVEAGNLSYLISEHTAQLEATYAKMRDVNQQASALNAPAKPTPEQGVV